MQMLSCIEQVTGSVYSSVVTFLRFFPGDSSSTMYYLVNQWITYNLPIDLIEIDLQVLFVSIYITLFVFVFGCTC